MSCQATRGFCWGIVVDVKKQVADLQIGDVIAHTLAEKIMAGAQYLWWQGKGDRHVAVLGNHMLYAEPLGAEKSIYLEEQPNSQISPEVVKSSLSNSSIRRRK